MFLPSSWNTWYYGQPHDVLDVEVAKIGSSVWSFFVTRRHLDLGPSFKFPCSRYYDTILKTACLKFYTALLTLSETRQIAGILGDDIAFQDKEDVLVICNFIFLIFWLFGYKLL